MSYAEEIKNMRPGLLFTICGGGTGCRRWCRQCPLWDDVRDKCNSDEEFRAIGDVIDAPAWCPLRTGDVYIRLTPQSDLSNQDDVRIRIPDIQSLSPVGEDSDWIISTSTTGHK